MAKPKQKQKQATPKKKIASAKPPRRGTKAKAPAPRPKKEIASKATAKKPSPMPKSPTSKSPKPRSSPSPVMAILDDKQPIRALQQFLDRRNGALPVQQAEIALGAAQLLLLPFTRGQGTSGKPEIKVLIDLVLARWTNFGEQRFGFHAQEFLRNAFSAVGADRARILRLEDLVHEGASTELLFENACAHAVARDDVEMLDALERALEAGTTAAQVRREPVFARYLSDPTVATLLAHADLPAIPVDVDPHRTPVRAALESLVDALEDLGGSVELRPPARLDTILDAERAAKVSLPNDYRAFLSITNGMRLLDREFLATADFRHGYAPSGDATALAQRAHHFVHAESASTGIADCVPLASWGSPDDWLLYDPRGRTRGGQPGYIATLGKREILLDDLVAALTWLEQLSRDILGTN